MSVLDRSALEASPLADLHAIASELSIDGYRRLRRAELIGAILDKQEGRGGDAGAEPDAAEPETAEPEAAEPAAAEPETAEPDAADGQGRRRRRPVGG